MTFKLEAYDLAHDKYHTEYVTGSRTDAVYVARKMANRLGLSVSVARPFMSGYAVDATIGDWGFIRPNIAAHNKQSRFNPKFNVSE